MIGTIEPSNRFPMQPGPLDEHDLVGDIVAARVLGTTRSTLRRWRLEGRHITYYKVGRSVRYKVGELYAFLAQHAVEAR